MKNRGKPPGEPPAYGRGTGVPDPVDIHVGGRVRTRRLLLGMNQETLAQRLGLTFQQVQKYESGANRISASRLSELAKILEVEVEFFFSGLTPEETEPTAEELQLREYLQSPETLELIRLYYAIPDSNIRRSLIAMVKAVAGSEAPEEE